MFSPRAYVKFSSQNGEKTEERKYDCLMDKNAHVQFFFFFFLVLGTLPFFFFFFFQVVGVIVVLFCLNRHDFFKKN